MNICFYNTIIGKIGISEIDGYITNVYFENDILPQNVIEGETPLLAEASQQLDQYLMGNLKQFTLPLSPVGTPFMKGVWEELCNVLYGQTATYKEIAIKTGNGKASRAIGLANNRNPIPIFIPCHRIIGSNGTLTGYRGGLGVKKILLDIEKKQNSGVFEYGKVEIEHLKKKDKKMGAAIDKIGLIQRKVTTDVFSALIESVLGQQISTKAAQTVRNRMDDLLNNEITPQSITMAGLDAIKGCGMSQRKAGYILGIAEAALTGTVNFNTLHTLTDEEIIKKLTALNGIGVWTAEMLLIFSLCRPNVVSYGDLAIRRGLMNLYGLKELPKEVFEKYRKRYSPHGSVASLYLWALSAI